MMSNVNVEGAAVGAAVVCAWSPVVATVGAVVGAVVAALARCLESTGLTCLRAPDDSEFLAHRSLAHSR